MNVLQHYNMYLGGSFPHNYSNTTLEQLRENSRRVNIPVRKLEGPSLMLKFKSPEKIIYLFGESHKNDIGASKCTDITTFLTNMMKNTGAFIDLFLETPMCSDKYRPTNVIFQKKHLNRLRMAFYNDVKPSNRNRRLFRVHYTDLRNSWVKRKSKHFKRILEMCHFSGSFYKLFLAYAVGRDFQSIFEMLMNDSDTIRKEFGKVGEMYKAIVYDRFSEWFSNELDDELIESISNILRRVSSCTSNDAEYTQNFISKFISRSIDVYTFCRMFKKPQICSSDEHPSNFAQIIYYGGLNHTLFLAKMIESIENFTLVEMSQGKCKSSKYLDLGDVRQPFFA